MACKLVKYFKQLITIWLGYNNKNEVHFVCRCKKSSCFSCCECHEYSSTYDRNIERVEENHPEHDAIDIK